MSWVIAGFGGLALVISLVATRVLITLGHRAKTYDAAGVAGQVKAESRPVPNTGGVAIFLALVLPLLSAVLVSLVAGEDASWVPESVQPHLPGLSSEVSLLVAFLVGVTVLHLMGLIDDRKPIAWLPKLVVTLGIPALLAIFFDTRLLAFLDPMVGGAWLSILITVLWFGAVTNAMNFLDNMDGLSAGVACVASATFLVSAILGGQWFIAAGLAMVVGACVGFLVFNFPRFGRKPGRIFMGDGGSLVLGFTLAFLTTRATFYDPDAGSSAWFAAIMPVIVLAVPLYDLISVTAVRLSQRRSPFVGDLQHLSHRLVRRGLTRRDAVLLIWILTAITSIGGISLRSLEPWQAVLVGGQTLLTLAGLAVFERSSREKS